MDAIKKELEAKLFSILHLKEHYLHQMLSAKNPLRQDTLLILINGYYQEARSIQEAIRIMETNKGSDRKLHLQQTANIHFN